MAGRHRRSSRQARPIRKQLRPTEMVDARTLAAHLVTTDAVAAGRQGGGRYVALCGADVLPAALVEPGSGRCRSCRAEA